MKNYKGKVMVSVKDFEVKGGKIVEGKKGLGFPLEMFESLCNLKDEILNESVCLNILFVYNIEDKM